MRKIIFLVVIMMAIPISSHAWTQEVIQTVTNSFINGSYYNKHGHINLGAANNPVITRSSGNDAGYIYSDRVYYGGCNSCNTVYRQEGRVYYVDEYRPIAVVPSGRRNFRGCNNRYNGRRGYHR